MAEIFRKYLSKGVQVYQKSAQNSKLVSTVDLVFKLFDIGDIRIFTFHRGKISFLLKLFIISIENQTPTSVSRPDF